MTLLIVRELLTLECYVHMFAVIDGRTGEPLRSQLSALKSTTSEASIGLRFGIISVLSLARRPVNVWRWGRLGLLNVDPSTPTASAV